ncbi:FAD-dependent monooxygenase [Litorimonas taeanensis]|uniref:FAD-dependent monooxygenase n=1 Tax=Litorimonas taeanensis TaxID=568099 RepID=UPI00147540E5|nr:FAD-dependent monooxygenase [Litorimonas taeanensis]
MKTNYDILIVGGGLIGQLAALACAKIGNLSIALIDGRDILNSEIYEQDGRAFALSPSSVRLLNHLKIETDNLSQPIQDMLITDGEIGEENAWRLHFNSSSIPHDKIAEMIESRLLSVATLNRLKTESAITVIAPHFISDLIHDDSGVSGIVAGKKITADLLIAADGAGSPIRKAAGILYEGRSYNQKSLVTTIAHSLPHEGLAVQRFLPGGPLAILPLIDQRSQIVWSDTSRAIEAACNLTENDFLTELNHRIGGHLGDISLIAPRQNYGLALQIAQSVTAKRLALIGDAAHVIHPMAGQGLNLGLRDIAALYDVLKDARSVGRDIGGAALENYASWRKTDVTALAAATDGLSYLYNPANGPLSRPASKALAHLRRAGLSAINESEFLKTILMSEAAGVGNLQPSLLT